MCKRQLHFAWCGALGEYGQIWETFAHMFDFLAGWIARTHEKMDQTEILVSEFV